MSDDVLSAILESVDTLLLRCQRLRVERDAARDIAVMLEQENAQLEKQRLNAAQLVADAWHLDQIGHGWIVAFQNTLLADSAVIKGDSPYNDTSRTGELA